MTTIELLDELLDQGVRLIPMGTRLKIVAPRGAITTELHQTLAIHKPDILVILTDPEARDKKRLESIELCGELTHFFNERAAILEDDALFSRIEANRLAMVETKATKAFRRWQALG